MHLNVCEAYRKLKGSVYYDKTMPYVRTRIAEFESGPFENDLQEFENAILRKDSKKLQEIKDLILDSVSVLTFPKNLVTNDLEQKPIVVSTNHADSAVVEKYNNFIDINIYGLIVSILWVTRIGYKIDKEMSQACYGNRIRENLVLPDEQLTSSPNLFCRYYDQYEKWRNNGLDAAEKTLQTNGVIITMLDLTRYYYNVNMSINTYKGLTKKYIADPVDKLLNDWVYCILQRYSYLCGIKYTFLPIGFLPSNVLANAYLGYVDEMFMQLDGTVYYGRYVDDIMWIRKQDDSFITDRQISELGEKIIADTVIHTLEEHGIIKRTNKQFTLYKEKKLGFNAEKLRFFFLSSESGKGLLSKVKKEISANTSEFNFIPEENSNAYMDLYKFDRDDSINKLRGIAKVSIDKYELSKDIGKRVLMSSVSQGEDEEKAKKFVDDLKGVLDNREIINNYLLWESILNYCVMHNLWDDIESLTVHIVDSLLSLKEDVNKINTYSYLRGNKNVKTVKDSLVMFYLSCFARSLSIVWGGNTNAHVKIICNYIEEKCNWHNCYDYIINLKKYYFLSRMNYKTLVPVTTELVLKLFQLDQCEEDINLSDINIILRQANVTDSKDEYDYLPYVLTPFEIGFSVFIEQVINNDIGNFSEYIRRIKKKFDSNFPGKHNSFLDNVFHDSRHNIMISDDNQINAESVDHKKNPDGRVRIAVANVRVSKDDLKLLFNNSFIDYSKRLADIGKIVNSAIDNKAEILVLPEAYIPAASLKILASKAKEKQMMIIGGMEHIIKNNMVWNITCILIPFQVGGVKYVVPFFRQKKYFSPKEMEIIRSKHFCIPKSKPNRLFNWHDINFSAYCCYELTSIKYRQEFLGDVDVVFAVEFNPDINYFSNIIESLGRDMYCYCVQVNSSQYGDSRIFIPKHNYKKNLLQISGGDNPLVIVGEVDIASLRKARKNKSYRENEDYCELPAGFPRSIKLK